MSKHTLKCEYIKTSNIESEVPEKQEIREPKNGKVDETNAKQEKDNFVPVLTITKEETALTKGDFKLQKVLVTENVAEEDNSNTANVINPLYSEVQSEVISGPQPIRTSPIDNKTGEVYKDKMEVSAKDEEDKKPKTRIPTLKFKQTVEKVKRERNNSIQGEEKIKHPTQGRRSSIPKLRRRRYSRSISDDIINENKEHNLTVNKKEMNTDKPDEEFDKLYEELVDEKVVEAVVQKILPEKIEDPDELETSFEEIIHSYDDKEIQPVMTETTKSKIPLSKQKSSHEERLPKQVERRLSLKALSLDEKEKQNGSQVTKTKMNKDISKIPVVTKDEHKPIISEEDINKTKSNNTLKAAEENIESFNKDKSKEGSLILPTKNKGINKRNIHQHLDKDIKLNVEIKETEKEKPTNKDSHTNLILEQFDYKAKVSFEHSDSVPDSSKIVMNMFPSPDNKNDNDSFKHTKNMNEVNETILEDEGGSSSNDSYNTSSSKDNLNEFKPKKSILSKIAIFQGKVDPANKPNDQVMTKDPINVTRLNNEKENHIDTENTYKEDINNEPNETLELKKIESLQISPRDLEKNRNKIKIGEKEEDMKNNKSFEEDVVETNVANDDIAIDLLEKDYSKGLHFIEDNNKKEKNVDYEEFPKAKGKVSDIISRIDSNDGTKLAPKKEMIKDLPKKRSIFSKIAMFEHQSSKEPKNVKEDIPENKIRVHTIKEIYINDVEHRKPKIIDTVLKSQPLRKSFIEDDASETPITRTDFDITDPCKTYEEISINEFQQIKPVEINVSKTLQDAETELPFNNRTLKDEEILEGDLVSKKSIATVEDSNKFTKTENLDSKSLNSNTIRSKSLVEAELGNAINGKVHQLVVRMNSSEKIEVCEGRKKEVIHIRERPRKKSVLEKIALFERKLTPTKSQSTETTTAHNIQKNDSNENNYLPKTLTEEEYKKKIEELEKASETYGKVEKMPRVELRNGKKMPVLAVGTALLDPRLIQPIIKAAIDLGYRAIDTAFIYGNEKEIGEAVKAKIDDGTVTREELFIVNKLWNTFHRQDLVEKACRDSLTTMGLDYFDLYLIHSPLSFKEGKDVIPKIANVIQYSDYDYMDAWYGMEELVKKDLAKSIGVSNFNAQQITRIEEKAHIKPAINQVECHPYLTQQKLAEECADRDIKLCCFGILGSKGTPDDLKTTLKPVIDDPIVVVLAAGLNVTAAQLLIRYQIDSGHLAVVKASSAAHLASNLKTLEFKLTPTHLTALNSLNANKRTYTFKGMGDTHRNYPFKAPL